MDGASFVKPGPFTGSCVVCMTGSDTGLAFAPDPEYVTAGLIVLGVPDEQAYIMVEQMPDEVFDRPVQIRVCGDCVSASPFATVKPGLRVHGGALPVIASRAA